MPLHEPDHTGLCLHCGLPPERAPPSDECPAHKLAEPAMLACEAIGLEFVEHQVDPLTKIGFAVVRSNLLGDSGCERFYDEQIAKVLSNALALQRIRELAAKWRREIETELDDCLGWHAPGVLVELEDALKGP